jgi:hypothetical protein
MQVQKGISEKGQQCLKKDFKVVPYNDKQHGCWLEGAGSPENL